MPKTVGSTSHIKSFEILPESFWHALRWIHYDQPEAEFASLLADVEPRLRGQSSLPPIEVVEGYRRVAAAYFIQLPGSVATLGGLRALRGYEQLAGGLLTEFAGKLDEQGIQQIQALVDARNSQLTVILQSSIYHQVTTVKHLWFDLAQTTASSTLCSPSLNWRPACSVPMATFGDLLDATFQKSLDCPALNGLRGGEEVLQSFLLDQVWDSQLPWELLCDGPRPIGCALLNRHPRDINELVYIGLIDGYRGRGLGQRLVQSAIQISRDQGAEMLVTAVDSQNWPACNIYHNLGFHEHRELAVWLPSRIKISTRVAA